MSMQTLATTGDQPTLEVSDPFDVGSREPYPCFLDGVVGVADRAEHPVAHGPESGPMLLESAGQIFVVVHPVWPLLLVGESGQADPDPIVYFSAKSRREDGRSHQETMRTTANPAGPHHTWKLSPTTM